jgi:hypothetical protein
VKAAGACTDKGEYDQTACTEQDFCSDVIDWTAGTCSDVRARGPFEAGARTITMTKQSVVDPSQQRVLDVVVWYPTTPGAGPIDGATNAVLNAPLDDSGGPYPVLLFSHGSCGLPAAERLPDAAHRDARLHRHRAAAPGEHALPSSRTAARGQAQAHRSRSARRT